MSRKSRTVVGASAVRTFAAERGIETGKRGLLSKSLISEYETETGNRYVAGHRDETKVTLTVSTTDKNGRKRTRKVERPLSEVRVLAGEAAGARGVLGAKAVEAASATLSEQLQAAK